MRKKLITWVWYYLRIYMNFPNGWIEAEDALEDHLGNGYEDLKKVLDYLDAKLVEFGIDAKFERKEKMTLNELLNQIDSL